MNRLAPLITQRPRHRFVAAGGISGSAIRAAPDARWLRDAKLFGASYLAGVVVFATLIA